MMRAVAWVIGASLACALPRVAAASDAPPASSPDAPPASSPDALFREGLSLFDAKQYAQACPKLAESYRLDAATGSLLALAACHEAEGKTATAWQEYDAVITRAVREGRDDRADAARQHKALLEPRLSRVAVTLAPGVAPPPGLVMTRDGVALATDSLGVALLVDPGDHRVEANAPGRQPWSTRITLTGGASALVSVPALAEMPTWSSADYGAWDRNRPSLRVLGIAAGAAGVLSLGVAGYFSLHAIAKNDDSRSDCTGNVCGPAGKQERLAALSSANVATISSIIGAVLVAGGVALFVVGRSHESGPSLAAAPAIDPRGAGFALVGSMR
jgi:hypothetical protein